MRRVMLLFAALYLLVGAAAVPEGKKIPPKPNYSKDALLYLMSQEKSDRVQLGAPEPYSLTVPRFGRIGFLFFTPASGVTGTSATPFDVVDPFAIATVPAAYTPETYRDRYMDWKASKNPK